MKYSSKVLDELHREFLKNPDDVFAKSKFFIYKALWKNERKDLALDWSKRRRKIWVSTFRSSKLDSNDWAIVSTSNSVIATTGNDKLAEHRAEFIAELLNFAEQNDLAVDDFKFFDINLSFRRKD